MGSRTGISEARLVAMVEEATIDCYNEEEQVTGLFTMIEDNLALPFQTTVLGIAVSVVSIDLSDTAQIVAICARASCDRRSRCSISRCRSPCRRARSGSRPIGDGPDRAQRSLDRRALSAGTSRYLTSKPSAAAYRSTDEIRQSASPFSMRAICA
jgi:hypothetical protein